MCESIAQEQYPGVPAVIGFVASLIGVGGEP
jgi:hypothetical protein